MEDTVFCEKTETVSGEETIVAAARSPSLAGVQRAPGAPCLCHSQADQLVVSGAA